MKFATFAQAISISNPAAPSNAKSAGRAPLTVLSSKDETAKASAFVFVP